MGDTSSRSRAYAVLSPSCADRMRSARHRSCSLLRLAGQCCVPIVLLLSSARVGEELAQCRALCLPAPARRNQGFKRGLQAAQVSDPAADLVQVTLADRLDVAAGIATLFAIGRAEERRVGKECVSTCRSWGSRSH